MPKPPRPAEATDGTPPGRAVTGAVCGAALLQPVLTNVGEVELAAWTLPVAQLGGTDNPPSEDS
jgi:hypothetical protein